MWKVAHVALVLVFCRKFLGGDDENYKNLSQLVSDDRIETCCMFFVVCAGPSPHPPSCSQSNTVLIHLESPVGAVSAYFIVQYPVLL
jgi:hypothetical protein